MSSDRAADANSETVITDVRPRVSDRAVSGRTPTASPPVATETARLVAAGDR
jgi:hypothetical protein